jgi:hypothetical protein
MNKRAQGCIIENAIISASVIAQNSAKIDNIIDGNVSAHGSSTVTNNNITGGTVGVFDSTVLSHNIITGPGGLGSQLFGGETNNWWRTTDQLAINAIIYDNKNDFNLGK